LGGNIFNLGFFPCFIAFPYIFKKIARNNPSRALIITGTLISAVVALQLGAFSVVFQTWLSGISELPFDLFVLLMQPIHLAIGIVEGLATAVVVMFIWRARPEIMQESLHHTIFEKRSFRKVLIALLSATIIIGGALSWFASSHPDGLEWSMVKTSGSEELETPETKVYQSLAGIQEKTAFLPDYGFRSTEIPSQEGSEKWAAVDIGTSVSGVVGSGLTLLLVVLLGSAFRHRKTKV
ncbi:MAG: PDGLE domain-containing protein, partial [SAR324 cluster bacterium]|nr:PDGLE domain-containing protein [SAR324 cluster bacterium]